MRAHRILIGLASGLVAFSGGCHREPIEVRFGETLITVEMVIDEARGPAYDTVRDDPAELAEAALRGLVVKKVVTAPPMTDDEAEQLTLAEARGAVQQCVAVELKRLLAARVDLDQESRARFAREPERYTLPESFRLQMIFVPKDAPDAEQLARELLDRIRESPDNFAALARQHSRSETATKGGRTEPMPGSAVHPAMRLAINQHHQNDEPFLVDLDRGWYLLKVLEFWPPPAADYEASAARVRSAVGAELIAELRTEIAAEVSRQHDIQVMETSLAEPELAPSAIVYAANADEVRVRDLFPFLAAEESVAGPIVRKRLASYRSWSEPALYFRCQPPEDPQITEQALFLTRLPDALFVFARDHMTDELANFAELHRQALVHEPRFVFDLWIMRSSPGDPYRHHRRLQDLLSGPEPDDETEVAAAGAMLRRRIPATAAQVDQYERKLAPVIRQAVIGEISPIIRSSRLGAFLALRLVEREAERALVLDNPADRDAIIKRFVESSSGTIIEVLADHYFEFAPGHSRLLTASEAAFRTRAQTTPRPAGL